VRNLAATMYREARRQLIEAGQVSADFGRAELTVHARDGTKIYLVPEDTHELVTGTGTSIRIR
jgi:hypothetical protein